LANSQEFAGFLVGIIYKLAGIAARIGSPLRRIDSLTLRIVQRLVTSNWRLEELHMLAGGRVVGGKNFKIPAA